MVVMTMVAALNEKVIGPDMFPQIEQDVMAQKHVNKSIKVDDVGNPVVVSKDFILNMLSLAIGKPPRLDGDLGESVDVKV
jgi:hypothetical protein